MKEERRKWHHAKRLFEYLLPPCCLSCNRALPFQEVSFHIPLSALCIDCQVFLRPLKELECCPNCGIPSPRNLDADGCENCLEGGLGINRVRSAFHYQSSAGQIVRKMKYQRMPYAAQWLIGLAKSYHPDYFSHLAEKKPLLVSIPVSLRRKFSRGYNQSWLLAERLAKDQEWDIAPAAALSRKRSGSPQARYHTKEERINNARELFRVERADVFRKRNVLIVDDVITTGSTVSAVAEIVKEAGALDVQAFSILRARLREGRGEE